MRPRDDNVIPFRRNKPRKWTRPEDYGVPGVRTPAPAVDRARDWPRVRRTLAVWVLILVLIALTVGWSAWDLWG